MKFTLALKLSSTFSLIYLLLNNDLIKIVKNKNDKFIAIKHFKDHEKLKTVNVKSNEI